MAGPKPPKLHSKKTGLAVGVAPEDKGEAFDGLQSAADVPEKPDIERCEEAAGLTAEGQPRVIKTV
ncbi:hypothetical protein [Synechococcus sp. LA31]|uniref:hypothetical protein n=1 Tax=Synechococcus sp. LA31 TaxID=2741953 RepID=UPI001BDC928B|nr:hypothetical protein [Synechococcus sp. LA31]QVV66977.1 hypothetical protein KJJ24_10940 [Synechococcus sp. LA31]